MSTPIPQKDEDDIELSYTSEDDFKDEEEIELLKGVPRKKKRSWCKCALLAFAVTLTAIALVQLADSYGQWLEVRVFPPRVVAAAHACGSKLLQSYQVEHAFRNGTHLITVQKPEVPFVVVQPNTSWVWDKSTLRAVGECVNVLIYSI